jgi:transcriptional regulator with GAF, ATPase, and Fis domain
MGILLVATSRCHMSWPDEMIPRLRIVGEILVNSLVRTRWEESLQAALSEIKALKAQIEADYHFVRQEIDTSPAPRGIIGKSPAFENIMDQIRQVAITDATVLFLGETGTGKGYMARTLHNLSRRKNRPFMHINCAALSPTLIESEFFGHEKGAFTGAHAGRIGWFEKANGTTLFLDEIGELPLELQAKLLRILQDGEFERVGGVKTIRTDVRVIAATNRDLKKEMEAGRFRPDLWYRMTVFPIHIPPLRDRADDIPLFVNAFVDKYARAVGRRFDVIPEKTIWMLKRYTWPGNIRELENLIERAVIASPGGRLEIPVLHPSTQKKAVRRKTLQELEKDYILDTLESTYWRIQGPSGAAALLDLNPSTLRARMRKLGIRRPNHP